MDSLLPIELHEYIISYCSYQVYTDIRLVCKTWWEIIEKSSYSEILSFVRIIMSTPEYNVNWKDGDIVYNTGVIHKEPPPSSGNSKWQPMDKRKYYIYRKQTMKHISLFGGKSYIDKIVNSHGTFKLLNMNMSINDVKTDIFCGLGSHIIQADNDTITTATSECLHSYDKLLDKWHCDSIINPSIHMRRHIWYQKHNNSIIFIKNGITIGTVFLPTSKFGFGPTYFAMKTDKIYFWPIVFAS